VWRCHLPLRVPAEAERCGLEVGGEVRHWREGEALVFCDAHRHRAWNDSDEPRLVLVFDVMKPAYRSRRFWICGNVLAAIADLAQTRFRPLSRLPRPLLRLLHRALGLLLCCALPIQRIDPGALPARLLRRGP
jgi:hypothetical protein